DLRCEFAGDWGAQACAERDVSARQIFGEAAAGNASNGSFHCAPLRLSSIQRAADAGLMIESLGGVKFDRLGGAVHAGDLRLRRDLAVALPFRRVREIPNQPNTTVAAPTIVTTMAFTASNSRLSDSNHSRQVCSRTLTVIFWT